MEIILDNFSQSSRSILDNIKASCVNNVGDEFGNIYSSVEQVVTNLKTGTQKINAVAPNVSAIYIASEAHVKAVDSYNVATSNISRLERTKPSQSSYKDDDGVTHKRPDDSTFGALKATWTRELASWKNSQEIAKTTALQKQKEVLALETTILANLGATSTLGTTVGSFGSIDTSNNYSITLENGMVKKGTRMVDVNGKLISDTYQIVDESNNVIEDFSATYTYNIDGTMNETYTYQRPDSYKQTGMATYNADGNRVTDKYQMTSNSGDSRNGCVYYNDDGSKNREQYNSVYTNGNVQNGVVTFNEEGTKVMDDYLLVGTDGSKRNGYISYDSNGNVETDTYESTYSNGSSQNGVVKYRNDGSVKEDTYRLTDSYGNKKNGTYSYDKDGHITKDDYDLGYANGDSITGYTEYYDNGTKKEERRHILMENGRAANTIFNTRYDSQGNITYTNDPDLLK